MEKIETNLVSNMELAVQNTIKDIIEDEIEKAKQVLEKKLREKTAQISISMAKWADVQSFTDRIVVTFRQINS